MTAAEITRHAIQILVILSGACLIDFVALNIGGKKAIRSMAARYRTVKPQQGFKAYYQSRTQSMFYYTLIFIIILLFLNKKT
jgi:hypothetical protein